jgi:hypothetical protein
MPLPALLTVLLLAAFLLFELAIVQTYLRAVGLRPADMAARDAWRALARRNGIAQLATQLPPDGVAQLERARVLGHGVVATVGALVGIALVGFPQ